MSSNHRLALKQEIVRLYKRVRSFEKNIQQCRDFIANMPHDPVEAALGLQDLHNELRMNQDALNRRVLQLVGADDGVGIETTWQGSRDPWL
jgi:hypothetical protein